MQVPASKSIVDRWQHSFNGPLLAPSHNDYNAARQIWNGMIDRSPALIARCTTSADVATAIRLAQSEHLPVSVRGGGHGVAGNAICQNGLVIDLTPMREISVDPQALRSLPVRSCFGVSSIRLRKLINSPRLVDRSHTQGSPA